MLCAVCLTMFLWKWHLSLDTEGKYKSHTLLAANEIGFYYDAFYQNIGHMVFVKIRDLVV